MFVAFCANLPAPEDEISRAFSLQHTNQNHIAERPNTN